MLTFRNSITHLMKSWITALIVLFLSLAVTGSLAQTGHSVEDEEFNLFLFTLAAAFFAVVLGATLIGSLIATLFLLCVFLLVSAGVLSVGVLVGFYRRSVAAGFRTVLMIACIGGGMTAGSLAFWLIDRVFDIHLQPLTALLAGAFSGLVGGLLLGVILFNIIRVFLNYFRKKLVF